jgi:hypothetical protein
LRRNTQRPQEMAKYVFWRDQLAGGQCEIRIEAAVRESVQHLAQPSQHERCFADTTRAA